ncbi:MAG TPA: hypothetical protein VLF14_07435, partial [Candidatus Binatia bacterium]|nr:hypothetical protein [Candidatus Binatia bacterium]
MRPLRRPSRSLWLRALAVLSVATARGADDHAERLKDVERKIQQTEQETKSIEAQAEGVLGEID